MPPEPLNSGPQTRYQSPAVLKVKARLMIAASLNVLEPGWLAGLGACKLIRSKSFQQNTGSPGFFPPLLQNLRLSQ